MRLKQELALHQTKFNLDRKNKMVYRNNEPALSANDLILILLSISPVRGNIKLQKEIFLSWKEIFANFNEDLGYFPYKYGAYSRLIEDCTKLLILENKIKIEKRKGQGSLYSITNSGKKTVDKKLRKYKSILKNLQGRKMDWDDWSPKGILRYVYRNYPEYTTKTKVPSLKW